MTIANQIQRIKTNITNAYQEIEKFNVNVTEYNNKSDKLAQAISQITVGDTINNQNKTITENGTYSADEGYTGLGEVVVNVPTSRGLPSSVTKYDYLEKTSSSGYVNLYFKPTNNTKLDIDFAITNYVSTGAGTLLGYYSTTNNERFFVSTYSTSSSYPRAFGIVIGSMNQSDLKTPTLNTKYNITMSKDGIFINNVLVSTPIDTGIFESPDNAYLFQANGYSNGVMAKIYGVKVYENDELVYQLVPVKDNITNKCGMYDVMTGHFFETSNNSFVVGNETSGGNSSGGGGGEEW